MEIKRKPTRRDLLLLIGHLQNQIGDAIGSIRDDQSPDSFEAGLRELHEAHDLCIEARSYDPPLDI